MSRELSFVNDWYRFLLIGFYYVYWVIDLSLPVIESRLWDLCNRARSVTELALSDRIDLVSSRIASRTSVVASAIEDFYPILLTEIV